MELLKKNFIIDDDNYNINYYLKSKNIKKIFILTGENSYYKSGANKYFDKILSKHEKYIYYKKNKIVKIEELKKIIKRIYQLKPDLILAVGGGSVIDYAKLANVLSSDNLVEKIKKNKIINFKKKSILLAIPTTAGSGTEVTTSGVVYIGNIKFSIEHKLMRPDHFFLFPKLVISANSKIRSSAALDALSQSIESMISLKSNRKSVRYATEALEICSKNLLPYLINPNEKNTMWMCLFSNLAGEAINISRTTAPHAVSYPLTSHYKVDHGHAVFLTLEKFLKFNYLNYNKSNSEFNLINRYNKIFSSLNLDNFEEFNIYLKKIFISSKLKTNFYSMGININKFINVILKEVNEQRLSNNPLKLNKTDIKKIILDEYEI